MSWLPLFVTRAEMFVEEIVGDPSRRDEPKMTTVQRTELRHDSKISQLLP